MLERSDTIEHLKFLRGKSLSQVEEIVSSQFNIHRFYVRFMTKDSNDLVDAGCWHPGRFHSNWIWLQADQPYFANFDPSALKISPDRKGYTSREVLNTGKCNSNFCMITAYRTLYALNANAAKVITVTIITSKLGNSTTLS